jgi:hypothetical protein
MLWFLRNEREKQKMGNFTACGRCTHGTVCLYFLTCAIGIVVCGIVSSTDSAFAQNASPAATKPLIGTSWEIALKKAQEHINYGLELGSRHAIYSAQAEFLQALRLVAREMDIATGNRGRETALDAGWRALDTMSSQQQLSRAQEQLAYSGGHEPMASMALYCLGRSFIAVAEEAKEESALAGPRAAALFQAALAVDQADFLAANELGVLWARCGQLVEAQQVMQRGLAAAPQPQMWRNLSIIADKLGDQALAQYARTQCDALSAARRAMGGDPQASSYATTVSWKEPADFELNSPRDDLNHLPAQRDAASAQSKTAAAKPTAPRDQELSLFDRLNGALKGMGGKSSATENR